MSENTTLEGTEKPRFVCKKCNNDAVTTAVKSKDGRESMKVDCIQCGVGSEPDDVGMHRIPSAHFNMVTADVPVETDAPSPQWHDMGELFVCKKCGTGAQSHVENKSLWRCPKCDYESRKVDQNFEPKNPIDPLHVVNHTRMLKGRVMLLPPSQINPFLRQMLDEIELLARGVTALAADLGQSADTFNRVMNEVVKRIERADEASMKMDTYEPLMRELVEKNELLNDRIRFLEAEAGIDTDDPSPPPEKLTQVGVDVQVDDGTDEDVEA